MGIQCTRWWRRFAGVRTERGDVPGWVMITVMTIVLVAALFAMFSEQITDFFEAGLDNLTSN